MITIHRLPPISSPFDRQALIPGWDQERVARARVLIAGIGALGNACAADLALTGVQRFVLVDFDTIDTTNLSRTILFRRGDEGRSKVQLAAQRLGELVLDNDPHIVPLETDVVWNLGWGVYRRVDLVFGCVDSAEARAAVGAPAWAFGVPAIFGGIYGYDGGVMMQGALDGPCVACSFSRQEWADTQRRYSCDQVRRQLAEEAKIPTTQVSSAFTAALMVQENLQILHGERTHLGTRLFFAGRWPTLERFAVRRSPRCPFHQEIREVIELPDLSYRLVAGEVVERLTRLLGTGTTIALGRDFLLTSRCKGCGEELPLWRPRQRVFEQDLVCDACTLVRRPPVVDPQIQTLRALSTQTDTRVLDLSFDELGTPPLHVLQVQSSQGTHWIELTGDLPHVLPGWPGNLPTR